MTSGSLRVRTALRATLNDDATADAASAATMAELFAVPLDRYAELIASGDRLIGFMTRGEDRGFTTQTATALEYLRMSRDAQAHHAALADWMEHRRGFTKIEWTSAGPLAACYFRRRPAVVDVVARMADWGIAPAARALVREIAGVLAKTTVHFVAAAFRPDAQVHHKLYFSQLVAPDTHAQVAARVETLVRGFGGSPRQLAAWQRLHAGTVHHGDSTIFVSISTTAEAPSASFKIDYPEVEPARAAAWSEHPAVEADARAACAHAGCRRLSYLGARFHPDQDPTLKYYADVPGLADAAGSL